FRADGAPRNPALRDQPTRSWRGGPGDIPSRYTADGPPASARSRRVKAREQAAGRKSRPVRQRVIAADPDLTSRDLTPNAGGLHGARGGGDGIRVHECIGRAATGLAPPWPGPAGDIKRRSSPVRADVLDIWKWRIP